MEIVLLGYAWIYAINYNSNGFSKITNSLWRYDAFFELLSPVILRNISLNWYHDERHNNSDKLKTICITIGVIISVLGSRTL